MDEHGRFSTEKAREVGERIGIDWNQSRFDVEQFRTGLEVDSSTGVAIPGRTSATMMS